MRLQFLKHLIDAASALVRPNRVLVLGSSSLLPKHPDLGEPGQPLELTNDADLLIEPMDDSLAALLKDAIGHASAFEQRQGYYADILRPAIAETLPAGWDKRLHAVSGYQNVFALDPYDLALVKLVVGRPKDLELLHALLGRGILEPDRLRQHYQEAPLGEGPALAAGRNLHRLLHASDENP
jgi:hypothetical protein